MTQPHLKFTPAYTTIDLNITGPDGEIFELPQYGHDDDQCHMELMDLPFIDSINDFRGTVSLAVYADHPSKLTPARLVEIEKVVMEIIERHMQRVDAEREIDEKLQRQADSTTLPGRED